MTNDDGWLLQVVAFARRTEAGLVRRAARLLESAGIERADGAEFLAELQAAADVSHRWRGVVAAARAATAVPGATQVATALLAAAATTEAEREAEISELLWTGPATGGVPWRRIDEALLELIEAARRELLVVTFSASEVPSLQAALLKAVDRGVRLTFVKDFAATDQDQDPAAALGGAAANARVLTWPTEQRPQGSGGRWIALLHAKCAVADDNLVLISSANVSRSALAHNMELGLLVRGGPLPGRVVGHFSALAESGILRHV